MVDDVFDDQRLAAGCGNPSNYMSFSSEMNGVMVTSDGGNTWTMTNLVKSAYLLQPAFLAEPLIGP
jgi:hypothetical protein